MKYLKINWKIKPFNKISKIITLLEEVVVDFVTFLKNNLTITTWTWSNTFTRSSISYVRDFEWLLKSSVSWESRFNWARRVENLCRYSEDFSNGVWSTYSWTTKVGNTVIVWPSGNNETVMELTFPNNWSWIYQVSILPTNRRIKWSVRIRTVTWTWNIKLFLQNPWYSPSISISTTWQRITSYWDVVNDLSFYIEGYSAWMSVYITKAQCEDITWQSNSNAWEYISSDVLASPYHWANVDRVKYFLNENWNTETSNVITEATWADIIDSIYNWIIIEGQNTNLAFQSTNPSLWAVSNLSLGASSTSPDWGNNAYLFSASGWLDQHIIYQYPTVTLGNIYTISIYAKASGSNYLCIGACHASAVNQEVLRIFDLSDGSLWEYIEGSTSGILHNSSIEQVGDFYRCSITVSISTGSSFRFSFWPSPAKTWNTSNWYGTVYFTSSSESVILYGSQCEELQLASSLIATVSSSVTRVKDNLYFPTSWNILNTVWTVILEYTPNFNSLSSYNIFLLSTYVDSSNYTALLHDWTNFIFRKRISWINNDSVKAQTLVIWVKYKIWFRYNSTTWQDIWINWIIWINNSNTSNIQLWTNIEIWSDWNWNNQNYWQIRNLEIYNKSLSNSQIVTLTS